MVCLVVGDDPRRHDSQDFGRDRMLDDKRNVRLADPYIDHVRAYLVVGNEVVAAHPLDLERREDPADIIDDLDVSGRSLQVIESLSITLKRVESQGAEPFSTATALSLASSARAGGCLRAYRVTCTTPQSE